MDLTDESEAEDFTHQVALESNRQDDDSVMTRSWKNELANKDLTNTLDWQGWA